MPNEKGLSPKAAESLLALHFAEHDKARMDELAQKNRAGALTEVERKELELYVRVGDLLSLLHLKARRSLDHQPDPGS
jgi:hypothetical protein